MLEVEHSGTEGALLELVVERLIVEEDVGVLISTIEPVFYLADAVYCPSEIGVACKNHEAGVCSATKSQLFAEGGQSGFRV